VAGVIASLTGILAVAGAAALAVPVYYRYAGPEMNLIVPVLTYVALFGAVGAAGGLGLGFGCGGKWSILRGLLGGIVGGLLAAIAYEVTASLLFPQLRVDDPIPKEATERLPRLMMHLGTALFVTILAVMTIQGRSVETQAAHPLS
jgi:hypothetical protein